MAWALGERSLALVGKQLAAGSEVAGPLRLAPGAGKAAVGNAAADTVAVVVLESRLRDSSC